MTDLFAGVIQAWRQADLGEIAGLVVIGLALLAILISGVLAWWRGVVESYDPNWEREGNRPRW
jgi:hypothetical protein